MRIKLLLHIVIIFIAFPTKAQYIVKNGTELLNLKKLPQEKAYLDHTGSLLFSGEYIHYAFYGFNTQSNKLTNISKIGYVALVDENQNYVFEHKIKLDKGLGQGDFFITAEIPSGKYKLLGYTQWMKNSGLTQIFKDDIVIVNPYMENQSNLLEVSDNKIDGKAQSYRRVVLDSSMITISIDKNRYRQRQKVNLSITNYKGNLAYGSYTIKVQKKEELSIEPPIKAVEYATSYLNVDKQIPQKIGDSLFLPEQRGELFFGNVRNVATGQPVKDIPIILSIPGKEFLLKFSQTDEEGNFYSYLRKNYKNPVAVVQIEEETERYEIQKGTVSKLNLDGLTYSNFRLSKEQYEYIQERSILNQIENQFFTAKPDSVLQGETTNTFGGGNPEIIILDEYTRFPTFGETLVEVVANAGYRNGGTENDYIRVAQDFKTFNEDYNSFPAIVLIDGVFIRNHEKIRALDARRIEKVSLIRDQFRLGGKDYQGLVAVETFKGDFWESYDTMNSLVVRFEQPVAKKNYYKQYYSLENSEFSRIPDYRRLLFWKPQLMIKNNSYDFEFFTSDLEGEYEIILNGFTSYGKPITVKKTFYVSKDVN